MIPSLEELAVEKNWRLKLQVIDYFPMLARQLGESFFNEKLNCICTRWLNDNFFAIRQAALNNYKQITVLFGETWAQKHLFPNLFNLKSEVCYLHRMTPLFGI
jgi:serine/threonine-protein phosphatase 2A regulatory subunit A